MSFKKRSSKSIALAIVGISCVTPLVNTVSAMEPQEKDNQPIAE